MKLRTALVVTVALVFAGPSLGLAQGDDPPVDEEVLFFTGTPEQTGSENGGAIIESLELNAWRWWFGQVRQATLSPNGKQVAYLFNQTLHIADVDGQNARAILSAGRIWWPAWSPDGDKIACYTSEPLREWDNDNDLDDDEVFIFATAILESPFRQNWAVVRPKITVVDLDGEIAHEHVYGNDDFSATPRSLSWSPDGDIIAYERYPTIYGFHLMSDESLPLYTPRRVVEEQEFGPDKVLYSETVRNPRWNPVGDRIAVDHSSFVFGEGTDFNLGWFPVDGGPVVPLTNHPRVNIMAEELRHLTFPTVGDWSPDGTELAYINQDLHRFGYQGGTVPQSVWDVFGLNILRENGNSEKIRGWMPAAEPTAPGARYELGSLYPVQWTIWNPSPVKIRIDPDRTLEKDEEFVVEVVVTHRHDTPSTYTFPGDFVTADPEQNIDLFAPKSEPKTFVLSEDEPERIIRIPAVAKERGFYFLFTELEVTDSTGETVTFTPEIERLVKPFEIDYTLYQKDFFLDKMEEEDLGPLANAYNDELRAMDEDPLLNLMQVTMDITNGTEEPITNVNLPYAKLPLRLISSKDPEKPGVPLKPIRLYQIFDGAVQRVIELNEPDATAVTEFSLLPGKTATFTWLLEAFDANPEEADEPDRDDSIELCFEPLVLGGLRGKTVRGFKEQGLAVIDQPLLEWGILPNGSTSLRSGQLVRSKGYIENISTRDDGKPQDIRVMVYQLPSGNLGGGFMFDAVKAGQPTPSYYVIFELPAEGPGKVKNLNAIMRSFPTTTTSTGEVTYGVRVWTVDPDPGAPDGEVVEEASNRAILKEGWEKSFKVNFSNNRQFFRSPAEECYALAETVPEFSGILPFLCGVETGLTTDMADGMIGLGSFLFKSGQQTLDAGVGIVLWELHNTKKVWDAILGDEAAKAALLQEAYVQYRTFVELGVMAGEAGTKVPMAFEQFGVEAVGSMADLFFAIEKGDVEGLDFAVGKFLGANPDLLLEPLIVARNYQRMSKAMMALDGELTDQAIRTSVVAEKQRQAFSLDNRLADAVAAGRAPEKALLPGDILSDAKLLDIYGVTRQQRELVQKIAKENGVVITFRSRNPLSVKILQEGRGYPKPQALKHKTVNQIDIDFLGYRSDAKATLEMVEPPTGLLDANGRALTGDSLDTAITGELDRLSDKIGGNDLLRQEVRDRMKTRAKEWNKLFYDKLDTTQAGVIDQKITTAFEANLQSVGKQQDLVKQVGAVEQRTVTYAPVPGRNPRTWEMKMTGPKDAVGNPGPPKSVTGDVDFMAILDEAGGLIRDPKKRADVYNQLEAALDMQHGESYSFFLQEARLEHLRCCARGADDAEAMVAISGLGDSTPRAAYFLDNISLLEKSKNAKYLPRRGTTATSFLDFILRPGEIRTLRRVDPSGEFMLLDGIHITTKPALDLVNRYVPLSFEQHLELFLTSPNFIGPALILRLFDTDGEVSFSNTADTPVIRADDESGELRLRQWTEADGWMDIGVDDAMAAGDPDVLEIRPMTMIPQGAYPNSGRVEISSQLDLDTEGSFFAVGDRVVINPGGPNEEFRTVQGFGSLIFAEGLQYSHWSGETIVSLGPDTTDRDGDGLTGAWETLIGTNPDLADTDRDGRPDGSELANGFDPLDRLSGGFNFTLGGVNPAGEMILEWDAVAGEAYAVEFSAALGEQEWTFLRFEPATDNSRKSITVQPPANGGADGFFRLRLLD